MLNFDIMTMVPFAILGFILIIFLFFAAYSSRYLKAGPNEVLIISGRKSKGTEGKIRGFHIVSGGGVFVWPIIEKADRFSLETMTIEIKTPEVYTTQGVPVKIDGVAQIKVKNDDISISTAVEQFLSKTSLEINEIAKQTLEGHLRAIIGTITVEEVIRNRDVFAQKVQEVSASDLANMGLNIVSFTIKDISDSHGYLEALGKPQIALIKRSAIIAEAEAQRDATIKSAQANQLGQTAKYEADTQIAQSDRDYKLKVADYTASVNQKKAEADLAYDLQKFKTEQLVRAEEIEVQVVQKEKEIEVQEKEILRKEKELNATVQKPADAQRYQIEALALAEQSKLKNTALGQAEATKSIGMAEADANKARGLAEAEIIKAKGSAEAEAMQKKADAWKYYNEAAILQMFIDKIPEIAGAISSPLSKTDKIVVISGDGSGVSHITKDITSIISQLPPVLEALTGLKIEELLKQLPKMVKKSEN
ncbi:MAG: flotillin family protein [Armatimonadetes bacterium]|nr:flotillin family protein [Armatimonadota bacterium]